MTRHVIPAARAVDPASDKWRPWYFLILLLFGSWLLDHFALARSKTYLVQDISAYEFKEPRVRSRSSGDRSMASSPHYDVFHVLRLKDGPSFQIPVGSGNDLVPGDTVEARVTLLYNSCLSLTAAGWRNEDAIRPEQDLKEYLPLPIAIALISFAMLFTRFSKAHRPEWRMVLIVLILIWCLILLGEEGLTWLHG